jgi:hypothetical protein
MRITCFEFSIVKYLFATVLKFAEYERLISSSPDSSPRDSIVRSALLASSQIHISLVRFLMASGHIAGVVCRLNVVHLSGVAGAALQIYHPLELLVRLLRFRLGGDRIRPLLVGAISGLKCFLFCPSCNPR